MDNITVGKFRTTRFVLLISVVFCLFSCASYYPEQAKRKLKVAQPFIDLYRESDANSEIFYVVEQDELITVIGEVNQFYRIETTDGLQGWITEQEVLQTTNIQGQPVRKVQYGIIYF